jgi:hypothetical protein
METKLAYYCGGLASGALPDDWKTKDLNLWPKAGRTNVNLEVTQLYDHFWRGMPAHYEDFLEIAAYLYSGDQALARVSKNDVDNMGARWRRTFHYHIPVRVPEFWNQPDVKLALRQTLEFLTEDYYDFTFLGAAKAPEVQTFLGLEAATGKFSRPDRLALFSGGLDSLGGVVRDAIGEKSKLLLLNHRSNDKFSPLYETLFQQLTEKVRPLPLSQVRVLINKHASLSVDYCQRARSFLFAAMGMTVAAILKLDELTCYENGVVSLNLPLCGQITGAKATRTTHPRVIRGLEKLGQLLARKKDFKIHTPFFWHTKGDVVSEILKQDCGPLIASSRSCAGTILRSKVKPHCGVCSQCIDRRIGVIANQAEAFDPASGYEIDVFSDTLPKAVDKIMTAEFINRAFEVESYASATEFIGEQPEVALALPYLGGTQAIMAERILKLYKRHAAEVETALEAMQVAQLKAGRRGKLPADCLTRIMCDPASVTVLPAGEVTSKAKTAAAVLPPTGEIGRLRWDNDFNDVYVGGVHYDLKTRDAARHCIRYLVMMEAFDKSTARHLEKEINKHVREQVKRDVLKPSSDGNLRIQHYFSGSGKDILPLRKEIVKSAGRNGCFYLHLT